MRTSCRLSLFVLAFLSGCASAPQHPSDSSRGAEAAGPVSAAPPAAAAAPAEPARPAAAGTAIAPTSSAAPLVTPDTLSGAAAERVSELAKKTAPLVDAFLNSNALFTRDGKQLLLVSNRDGLPQLYLADALRPDSPARRLLELKERVTLDATMPDGKALLFRIDQGADETPSGA